MSGAELFAKVVQIEHRGVVMGDRSAGRVEEARRYMYPIGRVGFGALITVADIIMQDGKSLEHTGVVPDQIVLPAPADLASGRDPVLAAAAASLGVTLSAEDAGRLFPYEWPPDLQGQWISDTAF
jgi:C-terminal processing protease CtpA/Prc